MTSSVSLTTCGRVGLKSSSEPARETLLKLVIPLVILHDFGCKRTIRPRTIRLARVLKDRLAGKWSLGETDRIRDAELVDLVPVLLAHRRQHLLRGQGALL